jgi:phenylacetate-coenzyme A ligase PaaK-like adenylate-forming protein
MDTSMISRVLWQRHALRRHERWNQEELREHQRRDVTALRGFAHAHSPFYRHLHAGFEGAPLGTASTKVLICTGRPNVR